MIYFTILCFLCFSCSFGSLKEISSEPAELIIGGENADIKDFPYQLSLGIKDGDAYAHLCGASIISPSWALSAAHCLCKCGLLKHFLRIRSGSSFKSKGGMLHHVQKFMVHPKYNRKLQRSGHDVSVIKVLEPFVYSPTVRPIELAKQTPRVGTEVVVTGWGAIGPAKGSPKQLQSVHLHVSDVSTCLLQYPWSIGPGMLCVKGAEAGHQAYFGDSGGPLVAKGKQVGIVSFGENMTNLIDYNIPGVYTDVASVRDWIIFTTKQRV